MEVNCHSATNFHKCMDLDGFVKESERIVKRETGSALTHTFFDSKTLSEPVPIKHE